MAVRRSRALEVGEDDPQILVEAAFVLAYFGEDLGAMVGLVDRALSRNPSFARGWYVSSNLRLFAGDADTAIEHIERSGRLSPREPIGSLLYAIGMAHFFKRRFPEAAQKLLLLVQDHPGSATANRALARAATRPYGSLFSGWTMTGASATGSRPVECWLKSSRSGRSASSSAPKPAQLPDFNCPTAAL
jgi:hypothetical protein